MGKEEEGDTNMKKCPKHVSVEAPQTSCTLLVSTNREDCHAHYLPTVSLEHYNDPCFLDIPTFVLSITTTPVSFKITWTFERLSNRSLSKKYYKLYAENFVPPIEILDSPTIESEAVVWFWQKSAYCYYFRNSMIENLRYSLNPTNFENRPKRKLYSDLLEYD